MNRSIKPHRYFLRYVAVERGGWIEYGFPTIGLVEDSGAVYYAKVIANVVGFLGFARAVTEFVQHDAAGVSLGFAIRGIKGVNLECITEGLRRAHGIATPPDQDALLYLRAAEEGPWETEGVAQAIAEVMLDHWGISRPVWLATPEFDSAAYKGTFFRNHFSEW